MSALRLSLRSMLNRSTSSGLTVVSIALSLALLLGIERIREGVKEGFEQSLSGMDLIVGARGSSLQLLLYSVFHIGSPNNNLSWQSYEELRSHPEVEWSIPISMGDSHRGYAVIGTDQEFLKHFIHRKKTMNLADGREFTQAFEAVIGSELAHKLQYKLGQKIVLSHGIGETSFHNHDDHPITVVGILKGTGTPTDRTVYVSLDSLESMHEEWGDPTKTAETSAKVEDHEHEHHAHSDEHHKENELHHEHENEHHHEHGHEHKHEHQAISAFLVGLKSKVGILSFQRHVNEYKTEALMAIVPGLTFMELWSMISAADSALFVVSIFVIFAGILGMLAAILSTLEGRRREIAILRALGAGPRNIFFLFLSESLLLASGACVVGLGLVYPLLYFIRPYIEQHYGLVVSLKFNTTYDFLLIGGLMVLAFLAGLIPAIRAYKQSLADGLTFRI